MKAFEIDNKIVIDIVVYEDNSIINSLYLDQLWSNHAMIIPKSEYKRYTINLLSGQINFEVIHDRLELPRINYLFNMNDYTFLYAVGMDSGTNFTDRLIKINVHTKDFLTWFQKNCHPGKPVFVARPGGKDEDN